MPEFMLCPNSAVKPMGRDMKDSMAIWHTQSGKSQHWLYNCGKETNKKLWAEPDAKIATVKVHRDKNDVSKTVTNKEFETEAKA
eukprot:1160887-Ditylum_brightwellii.AAC.1